MFKFTALEKAYWLLALFYYGGSIRDALRNYDSPIPNVFSVQDNELVVDEDEESHSKINLKNR